MQTFLPLASFSETASVLDWRRLGKQRVECLQLIKAIDGSSGWRHHPAAKMWSGHVPALHAYSDAMIREWIKRGYRNTMAITGVTEYELPPWFGDEAFHASHRSNLLRKDPDWYGQFGWTEPPDLPYVWPLQHAND